MININLHIDGEIQEYSTLKENAHKLIKTLSKNLPGRTMIYENNLITNTINLYVS